MRLLLDTHCALWMFAGSPEISPELEQDLTDPGNEVFFSEVSALEIVIKHALGKLPLPDRPDIFVPAMVSQHELTRQPITFEAILQWGKLPLLHRDPFDRLLIAQSIQHGFHLVTLDREIQKYPVPIHWR